MSVVPRIASFHLTRHAHALPALASLGIDRLRLRRVPGLVFWRLLGTGAGSDTGPGADLRRTALFAVWDDEAALLAFIAATADRRGKVTERYEVRLRAAAGHGAWHGVDVVGLLPSTAEPSAGPIAIVTRAHVHVRAWRAFRAAGPAVSDELQRADGLLAVVGVGEAPAGHLGTFSLWRDLDAARVFAHRQPHHAETVRRTRADGWYGEELFARFEPYASSGSWDGRDPLRDIIGNSIP